MTKKTDKEQELLADLQRTRADFENYRNRVQAEKTAYGEAVKAATIMKLLPIIDTIERAVVHVPADLADNKWAQGITGLAKNLEKSLGELGLVKIQASPDTVFDPNVHEAVMMEEGQGQHEVITEELRAGYMLGGQVIRPSMVRVKKVDAPGHASL